MSATTNALELEPTTTEKPVSQWALAWRRLLRHKLAMIGLFTLLLVVVASLGADVIAPYPYADLDLKHLYAPMLSPGAQVEPVVSESPNANPTPAPDVKRTPIHLLGTDGLGRDIASRLLYAGRYSLFVALVVTILNIVVGTIIGAVAGAVGGWADTLLMRFTDLMLTLPQLPLLLILSSSLRQFVQLQQFLGSNLSVVIIIFVLVIFGWMTESRLVRGSVLSLRDQDFIAASRALGASNTRIIFQHLVPNSLAPIIVAATLGFGGVIISESALSFLGFGVMPPTPTWGNMLNEARGAPLEYLFTQTLSPGFCIFVTVLAINFLGDGLRDALDPRLKM
jgi:peptide/nickel transport system permease protein